MNYAHLIGELLFLVPLAALVLVVVVIGATFGWVWNETRRDGTALLCTIFVWAFVVAFLLSP